MGLNHNIIVGNLADLENMDVNILKGITQPPYDKDYGVKKENYYMINSHTRVQNPDKMMEAEYFNQFFNLCAMKGYSLVMLKF